MYIVAQAPAAAQITFSAASTTVFNIISGEPGAGTQCNLNIPGTNRFNGTSFRVRAAGYFTIPAGTSTSGATPLQIGLYGSDTVSFSAASGNLLYAPTAFAVFTLSSATSLVAPFVLEVLLNSVTGGIPTGLGITSQGNPNGVQQALGPTAITATNLSTAAAMNMNSEPTMQFAFGVIGGTSPNLGSITANLVSFVCEA